MTFLKQEVKSLAEGSQADGTETEDIPQVMEFVPYYSYKGSLKVTGKGTVRSAGSPEMGVQTLSFTLNGVDKSCAGNPPDQKNACGIHIHVGLSCQEDAGPHWYNQETIHYDPWQHVSYTAEVNGSAILKDVKVITGLSAAKVYVRAVVVHDSTGARVACGIITPATKLSVPSFTKYPGYNGSTDVQGSMIVVNAASSVVSQTIVWYFQGLPEACLAGPDTSVKNSCGVHIHEGFDCSHAGGHYYDHKTISEDPWATVGHAGPMMAGPMADATGPWGYAEVTSGKTMFDVMGRTMVVHDYEGKRAACGIIQPRSASVLAMGRYGSYQGTLQVTGSVSVTSGRGPLGSQILSYTLSGVDPACTENVLSSDSPPANACGIHIHANANCTDAGPHLFSSLIQQDPWAHITYRAKSGTAKGKGVEVVTGISLYDIIGKAFVVHDATGARVGCGYIGITEGML